MGANVLWLPPLFDHFAEKAQANPVKTRLLWLAVPTIGMEECSLVDEDKKIKSFVSETICTCVVHLFGVTYRLMRNSREIYKPEFKVVHYCSFMLEGSYASQICE